MQRNWISTGKSNEYRVGGESAHGFRLKIKLAKYLAIKKLDINDYKVKGQFIPFGDFRKRPGSRNVLLSGDAAGIVDPITGEGIAYAMQTGHAAANAVLDAQKRSDMDAISAYIKSYGQISRAISQANRWRYLIFPAPIMRAFAWAFADASTLQIGYLDLLAGTSDYDALPGLFLVQLKKGLKKLKGYILYCLGMGKRPLS